MCCGSHNYASPYVQMKPTPTDHHPDPDRYTYPDDFDLENRIKVEEAVTEEERCKCSGIPFGEMSDPRCVCMRKIDGEDMRCPVCRAYCPVEWTPRVMSKAAQEAMQRAAKH